jgi:hypothetical protein
MNDDRLTDAEIIAHIARVVAPEDRRVILNLVIGMDELNQTGKTAVFDAAVEAFFARMDEKARIART